MPSGQTSMLELPANVLLATHPACSERRHHQPCRRPYERKLGDQTKDDTDKEPREERSCGRSQTLLYNGIRTHRSLNKDAPVSRLVQRAGVIRSRAIEFRCELASTRRADRQSYACRDGAPVRHSPASRGAGERFDPFASQPPGPDYASASKASIRS
jgi:hypothetical protein